MAFDKGEREDDQWAAMQERTRHARAILGSVPPEALEQPPLGEYGPFGRYRNGGDFDNGQPIGPAQSQSLFHRLATDRQPYPQGAIGPDGGTFRTIPIHTHPDPSRRALIDAMGMNLRQFAHDLNRAPDNPVYEYHVTVDTGYFRAIGTMRVQNLDAPPIRVPRMTGDALYPEDV